MTQIFALEPVSARSNSVVAVVLHKELLTDILQTQWGFQGYVQSDWAFGMRDAKKAALAGQHVEMPFRNVYHRFLPDLIKNGEVAVEVVDDAALRILRQLVKFGQGAIRATMRRM